MNQEEENRGVCCVDKISYSCEFMKVKEFSWVNRADMRRRFSFTRLVRVLQHGQMVSDTLLDREKGYNDLLESVRPGSTKNWMLELSLQLPSIFLLPWRATLIFQRHMFYSSLCSLFAEFIAASAEAVAACIIPHLPIRHIVESNPLSLVEVRDYSLDIWNLPIQRCWVRTYRVYAIPFNGWRINRACWFMQARRQRWFEIDGSFNKETL